LSDTICQDIVTGPVLWNVFFHDVALPASCNGGQEAMFADDLNVFKRFDVATPVEAINTDMQRTREAVHSWGRRNRVTFDASKEHIVIIHPLHGWGDTFKLLGCLIDVKLLMNEAIDNIVSHARPKMNALLRTRGIYNHKDMFQQFKTHIWGGMEYQNGVILHAAPSSLDKIDRLQRHYVHELQLTEESAFLDYNFAPPSLRRDIGILGFLHKRVLGQCHEAVVRMFPFLPVHEPWHDKQLDSHLYESTCRQVLFSRSVFGMVNIYNRLPQYVVDSASVSNFQKELTHIARHRCSNGLAWKNTFSTR